MLSQTEAAKITKMKERFSKLEHSAWSGFLSTYGKMNSRIENDLRKKFDISHVEFEILLRLYWATDNKMLINHLSKQSILSLSGVSRLVSRLDKEKWLSKTKTKTDKRSSYAVLTRDGKKRFELVMEAHIKFIKDSFLRTLNQHDLKSLSKIWNKVDEQLNDS